MPKLQETTPITPPIIETPRLTLRALQHDDLAEFVLLLDNWNISRWLSRVPYPYMLQDGENWLKLTQSKWRRQNEMALVAVARDSGKIIGGGSLFFVDGEIGYWIGEPYWGRGYATEITLAFMDYAFTKTPLVEVFSAVMPGNEKSIAVQRKAGMTNIGMRPYDFNPTRCIATEALCHGITKQQWLAR